MNFSRLIDNVVKVIKANAPEILTALSVAGVATTAALSAKAGYQTADSYAHSPSTPVKERLKASWRFYIPAAAAGAGTITCIICASKGNAARTAAAVTAYSVTEKAFSEYREKMVAELSERKEQKALDAIAQDRVNANPPSAISSEIVVIGRDEVLCCELYTGRYFRSSMETLRTAENDVNHWLVTSHYVSLGTFYDLLGLPPTDVCDKLGWDNAEDLMHLEFSAVLTPDNEPCLAFRYNYVKPLR